MAFIKGREAAAMWTLAALALLIATAFLIALFITKPIPFDFATTSLSTSNTTEPETTKPSKAEPKPKSFSDIPTSPARRHYVSPQYRANAKRIVTQAGTASDEASDTLPSGALLAAVESGRTVFLRNPTGYCELIGSVTGAMTQKLDDCFAGKAPGL